MAKELKYKIRKSIPLSLVCLEILSASARSICETKVLRSAYIFEFVLKSLI